MAQGWSAPGVNPQYTHTQKANPQTQNLNPDLLDLFFSFLSITTAPVHCLIPKIGFFYPWLLLFIPWKRWMLFWSSQKFWAHSALTYFCFVTAALSPPVAREVGRGCRGHTHWLLPLCPGPSRGWPGQEHGRQQALLRFHILAQGSCCQPSYFEPNLLEFSVTLAADEVVLERGALARTGYRDLGKVGLGSLADPWLMELAGY